MSNCRAPDAHAASESHHHLLSVNDGLAVMYGQEFASDTMRALSAASESLQLYIIGCLLLNITASVNPGYTRFESRLSLNSRAFSQRPDPRQPATQSATAGLYWTGGSESSQQLQFCCFHCNARVALTVRPSDPWELHRAVSPACYYVRLRDFVQAAPARPTAPPPALLAGDVEKFRRALGKLRRDLADSESVRLAGQFGFSPRSVAFAATRHFMRNGGTVPGRAGDLIACLHSCQEVFEAPVMEALDVASVLGGLACLDQLQRRQQQEWLRQ